MFRFRLQSHTTRRITAWLLILICAWMGSGGVLNHTESEFTAKPTPRTAASLHRQAAVPVDTCAACQWTQGLQGRTLTVFRVQFPLFHRHLRLASALTLVIARSIRHRSSRAPPVSSYFC
ncbi:MAG: hypothetical protein ACRYFS_26720 [Janthinobacterium lividum]